MSYPAADTDRNNLDDRDYIEYLDRVQERFLSRIVNDPIFLTTTNDDRLWEAYLQGFSDPGQRQYHNCHTCRRFIQRYGGLVTINQAGEATSAVWCAKDAPANYRPSIEKMLDVIDKSSVSSPFIAAEAELGERSLGGWNHLSLVMPTDKVHKSRVMTASQLMAEKRQDFINVSTALSEFRKDHVDLAVQLLRGEALYRSEKVLGVAEWLQRLYAEIESNRRNRTRVIWRYVATAPAGFCHPKSSMIGTLLEDLARGMDFESASRSFAAKMHPLRYQRPQAAPSQGAIQEAERKVKELDAAGSLARRFARLDEIQALWTPSREAKPKSDGVFSHLKAKGQDVADVSVPLTAITWEKFHRVVLPLANEISILAVGTGNYSALVTAVNPDAPPIIQWDLEHARNPVSWYVWHGGSRAPYFKLRVDEYYPVDAITYKPSMWNGGFEHHGKGVFFVIRGAMETRMAGAALFPEFLKSEWHGIRSVIEAYSKSAKIEGIDQPHAAGLMFSDNNPVTVRVKSGNVTSHYRIDRWD